MSAEMISPERLRVAARNHGRRWRNKIDLSEFFRQDEPDFRAAAKSAAGQLIRLYGPVAGGEIASIVAEFRLIADDPGATVADFDAALERLYDWGDVDKRLWINT